MMNNIPSSSHYDDDRQSLELRSRGAKSMPYRQEDESPSRAFIYYEIKQSDTLNSIALQYSVQVAEIKRANGFVTDQEIFALKYIRIPVPAHSSFLINAALTASTSAVLPSQYNGNYVGHSLPVIPPNSAFQNHFVSSNFVHRNSKTDAQYSGKDSGNVPLLQDYDQGSDASSDDVDNSDEMEFYTTDSQYGFSTPKTKRKKTKHAIKYLLDKADATVAAVRENLSERSPSLENGRGFHFIDATAPNNTSKGVWMVVISVIFMFVVVPLILTLMEEKSEEEQLLHSHNSQRMGDGSV